MPDYVRIGPPWGQINWLPNSGMKGPGSGGATYPATQMGWAASGGSCATTNVCSWGVSSQYGQQVNISSASSFWMPLGGAAPGLFDSWAGGWQFTSATTIPSGQILAVAEFPVPSVRGVWTFQGEVFGASNVRVWGQMQVLATGASAYASWNVGTGLPSTAAQQVPGTFRWTGQFPNAITATTNISFNVPSYPPFDMENVRLLIRTGDTFASGDSIHLSQLGLFQLDVPKLPDSAAAIGSIYAGASNGNLLPYPFSNRARDTTSFDTLSYCARFPAMPSYDQRQPCGLAIEVGSWLRSGFDYGGQAVEKRQVQDTSLTDAGAIAYEGYSPRVWTLPYIVDTTAWGPTVTAGDFSGAIDRAVESDPLVIDVISQNSTWMVRFDVHTVTNAQDSELQTRRQNLLTGQLVAQTAPIGYSPRRIVATGWSPLMQAIPAFGRGQGASGFVQFETQVVGDRSAYLVLKSGFGNNSLNNNPIGFLMGYQPGPTAPGPFWAASYIPSTGSAASMPNGLMGAGGSQVKFSISNTQTTNAAAFMLPPNAVAAAADTVRMFLLAGVATACTVPIFAAVGKMAADIRMASGASPFQVATTQVGFMNPLITAVASENQTIQVVDLGEIPINKNRKGAGQAPAGVMGGGDSGWVAVTIVAGTAASANIFGGAIDSLLLLPAGPSCFVFGVPSVGYVTQGPVGLGNAVYQSPMNVSMHPSYGVYLDPRLVGPSHGTPKNQQGAWSYDGPAPMAVDLSGFQVGPYPLVPPGRGQMMLLSLANVRSPGESAGTNRQIPTSRPITATGFFDFTNVTTENSWVYYPRWAFVK